MNKIKVITAAILAAIIAGSCHKREMNTDSQAPIIDVAEVQTDSVTVHKSYPGYLGADKKVDLVARVDGYLQSKDYTSGAWVKAGTVLFTIESSQYADAVKEAKATLESARSAYDYATKNYRAMQRALENDAVSRMEVLQAQNAMESAQSDIESAESRLQSALTTLGYCTIRAPFAGHVTKANYDKGAYLSGAGSPVVLATIYDDSKVSINFNVDERELADINAILADSLMSRNMEHIPLIFDKPLQQSYSANLSYISPTIDRSTGAMLIQAKIDNPLGELRSGMYCKILMPAAVLSKAMLIKDSAISTDQLGKYIYLVNDSNRVVYTPIETSEVVNDSMRIVTKGLRPGERYVTKALLKVRDGMKVNPRLTR